MKGEGLSSVPHTAEGTRARLAGTEPAQAGFLLSPIVQPRNLRAEPKSLKPFWRVARWVSITLALCAFGYFAVVNAFLYFNGISVFFKSTNTVNATYSQAYSLWPGVVHASGLRIVFQDENLQFSLEIKQLKARIVLWELLRRRFHAKWVDGSGAAFRMRHRIQPESRDLPWVSALSPIQEFPAPAVYESTVPEPPIPDSKYNLWTIHLENVDTGVDEVWVQFVRFAGVARAQGAFRLVPARTLWVGPASLAIERGRLYVGRQSLASHVAGSISCKVDFFDVRIPQGREVFKHISSEISVRAKEFVVDPFFQHFISPPIHVTSKATEMAINVRVNHGRVTTGSGLSYSAENVIATAPPLAINMHRARVGGEVVDADSAVLNFNVDQATVGPQSAIVVEGVAGSITTVGTDLTGDTRPIHKQLRVGNLVVEDARKLNELFPGGPPAVFESGTLRANVAASEADDQRNIDVQIAHTDLRLSSSDTGIHVEGALGLSALIDRRSDVPLEVRAWAKLDRAGVLRAAAAGHGFAAELRSFVANGTYANSASHTKLDFNGTVSSVSGTIGPGRATRVLGRKLTARGDFSGPAHRISGEAALALASLQVRSKKSVLSIQPAARLSVTTFDKERLTGKLGLALQLAGWNATYGDDAGQCSSLVIPKAQLNSSARLMDHGINATVEGRLEGVQLSWGADFRASGDVTVRSQLVGSASGPSGEALLSARLLRASMVSGKGGNSGWQAIVPELRIDGKIAREGQLVGSLAITADDPTGRIGSAEVRARLDVAVPRFQFNIDNGSAVLDGQLRMRDAQMQSGNHRIDGWWATIDTQSAQLVPRENLDYAGNFRASLRDATPILALLAQDGKLPNWLSNALPLSEMSVRGQMARRCRLTTIRVDQAAGGPLIASGTLQSTSELVRGAFLVRLASLKMLSAGVEVGPPDAGVSPLAGESWLQTRIDRLDSAARQILSAPCRPEPQRCGDEFVAKQ